MDGPSKRTLSHADVTGAILSAFFEVYRELGYGFSEVVYRRALGIVIRGSGLDAAAEVPLDVYFREALIGRFYADLVVNSVVLVEIKASVTIERYAEAQLLNYLKAAGGGVGMLLNFGRQPTFKRLVLGNTAASLPRLLSSGGQRQPGRIADLSQPSRENPCPSVPDTRGPVRV